MRKLAGKNVFVTGVTGFLGQAVFERLLLDFPDTRITLLVRPQLGSSGRQRVESLMGRPTFNALRDKVGTEGIAAALEERVDVVDGDFSADGLEIPGGLDVVIHCAATVAFDPPIDEGFLTNLVGAVRLYEAALANNPATHLLHVSTAYVAGVRKGVIPEATLDHRVDWQAESDLAIRARADVEAASRKPEILDSFLRKARSEHGRAGPQSVADDAEERRKTWVTKRLVEYGRARAQTLGWPDNYTFTKAMGERAVEDARGRRTACRCRSCGPRSSSPRTSTRTPGGSRASRWPSRSSWPTAAATIPDFPGIPEGIIDIIPADFVVNAMLAAAAQPARARRRPPTTTCRRGLGTRCSTRVCTRTSRSTSSAIRCPQQGRGAVRVPEWTFPGNLRVERLLRTAERAVDVADKVVTHLPKSKRMRDLVARVDRDKGRVDFVRRYSDLYGAYTEAEVIYTDDRTVELFGRADGGRPEAVPVRRGGDRLAVLPPGRALPGGDGGAPRAVGQAREAAGPDPRARAAGARAVRHGGDDPALQRRRVLRVVADGRPAVGPVARRARERVLADPVVPDGRPARPRRVPADVLPALRGRDGRGHRAPGRGDRVRVHAAEGLARRRSAGSASTAPPGTARC